ncbi:hypothetical protein H310_04175 [Aphanomyces invadans]|nr:hypothetical protein H310_04175 [Aphanomyces invadans]ETW05180.1 hypothetical protein H310_04175 [Aphanomyces invadans]|eukprot:XP_008866618.1 hypothetical protein H310_04175 [Aphanomyces invadans]
MGGGGLRILGHKKWHVWTRENIEKVRRDERLHEEKTKKETREKRKRDLDSRVEHLKRARSTTEATTTNVPPPSELNHINFFKDAEEYHNKMLIDPPNPKEFHEEGIALGGELNPAYRSQHPPSQRRKQQDAKKSHPTLPWYAHARNDDRVDVHDDAYKRDTFADPMGTLLTRPAPFLEAKKPVVLKRIDFAGDKVVSTRDKDVPDSTSSTRSTSKKGSKSSKLMDKLRAERLAREAAESSKRRR